MTENGFGKFWQDIIHSKFGVPAQALTQQLERPTATEASMEEAVRQQQKEAYQRIIMEQERRLLYGQHAIQQQAPFSLPTKQTSIPSMSITHSIAVPNNAVAAGQIYIAQDINGQTEVCAIVPKRLFSALQTAYRSWVDTPDYDNMELATLEEALDDVLEASGITSAPINSKDPQQTPSSLTPTESIIDKFLGDDIPYA